MPHVPKPDWVILSNQKLQWKDKKESCLQMIKKLEDRMHHSELRVKLLEMEVHRWAPKPKRIEIIPKRRVK